MARAVAEEALRLFRSYYVFPDRAADAAAVVERHVMAGVYDGLDEVALGHLLTEHLQGACGDKHLRVRPRPPEHRATQAPDDIRVARHDELRLTNHGIARVERLNGNVGYLDLTLVTHPDVGGPAVAAAMELVAHTYALVLDLRRNCGGSPQGVTFWCSYFFPDDSVHLNDIYDGQTGQTRQYWTLAHLPGHRYLDRPIWVLTSPSTFSAGEELCYNLQVQGRATLVGQTTRGGAHPTQPFPLSGGLEITIPVARSINPVTGSNWEGTGVRPDLPVAAEGAFDLAYRQALEHVTTVAEATMLAEARAALQR